MEEHLRRIAEEGYTILENAIELEFIDEIAEALHKVEAEVGAVPADNLFEGMHTTRVYNLLVHGPTFEKIPVHPDVLPVVEGVLDPGAPDLFTVLDRHRPRRAATADPRR